MKRTLRIARCPRLAVALARHPPSVASNVLRPRAMGELVRARFLEFERGVVERLRSSCRHMRDDEFHALARAIALRDFRTYLPPRLYDELVDQLSREGRGAGSA